LAAALAWPSAAQTLWDSQPRVQLAGSVHPRLAALAPVDKAPNDLAMDRMILVLSMTPAAQANLAQLLRDQQDPASPRYRQWLTPDQFGAAFGASQAQRDAAVAWLEQEGFSVEGVARSGLAITFSGTAVQVGKAFRTAIMAYQVGSRRHYGNATEVSVPQGLAGFVGGVVSLNDLGRKTHFRRANLPLGAAQPQVYSSTGKDYIDPGDLGTIYGMNSLWQAGTTGHGVAIAVVGRTDIDPADFTQFTTSFYPILTLTPSLPYSGTLTVVHNGPDPGITSADEAFEADLDTQWSTAAAPGASVQLVVSSSTMSTDGADLSAAYIVDNALAPILTTSFGNCEADLGSTGNAFYSALWQQAAAEGISVFVAAGDNGPAGCADQDTQTTASAAEIGVSGIASTPYDIAVGGTEFNEGSGTYWNTSGTPGTFTPTALGYIPEKVWNESGDASGGSGIWAGSGGFSGIYARPSWQVAPGVSTASGGFREIPDVSFNAAVGHDGALVYQGGTLWLGGGTSIDAPIMAGIMAMVVQQHGPQGLAGPGLYQLGNNQYASAGAAVFHDVQTGNNDIPGLTLALSDQAVQYYDDATGLGSINAAALVANWPSIVLPPISLAVSAPNGPQTVDTGSADATVTFTAKATDTTTTLQSYSWNFGDGSHAVTGTPASGVSFTITHTYSNTGTTPKVCDATLTVTDASGNSQSSAVTITVNPYVVAAITLPVTSVSVLAGIPIGFQGSVLRATAPGATITGYAWTFSDGGSAATASTSHTYGTSSLTPTTVTFTATDSLNNKGTATIQVQADTPAVMDANGDGSVDVRDLLVVCASWNPSLQATNLVFGGLNFAADLDGDGKVDDTDIADWIANFTPGAP
jgi:hypothetical protein